MSNNRMTQHRQQRENPAKEAAELRRENQRLKRQILKLQKTVGKLLEQVQVRPEPGDIEEEMKPLATDAMVCPTPGCGKPLTSVMIPGGTLRVCKDCGWRKKF